MSEEHACLVRARSDSDSRSSKHSFGTMAYTEDRLAGTDNAGGEPGNTSHMATSPTEHADTESGELLDYNDSSLLEQFHDDALRQAGCGLAQARVMLPVGLALAGAALELSAIPFILPSAEIELCILPHEKNWLVMISLMGLGLGALGWGALGSRAGRRRALLSCLAVNAVFAAIAAFMPTYGTFMMARFCSAIGSGGILPASYIYAGEMWWRSARRIALLICPIAGALGQLLASMLALAVLPENGADTLVENKEHFSAWHRYLLLCTLPILASLVSLLWTQESPRYLLDVGREVDAMMLYQSIHRTNQVHVVCGKPHLAANEPAYRLGELTLPGKRRPHHVAHSAKMFWQSFFQLFSSAYRNTTLSLGGMMLFSMAIQYYLSSYVPAAVLKMESDNFQAAKKIYNNTIFNDTYYNTTLENIVYDNVTFERCVFADMLMSHVDFKNCSFYNVALSNIKTSFTSFGGALFVNSTIIDTDMEVGRELDAWCVFKASTVRGMEGGCARHADLTFSLRGRGDEAQAGALAALVGAALALLPRRATPSVLTCACLILLSPVLYVCVSEKALYIAEALYRAVITLICYLASIAVLDHYPHHLRCTCLGILVCVSCAAGAALRALGEAATGAALATGVTGVLAALATAAAALK